MAPAAPPCPPQLPYAAHKLAHTCSPSSARPRQTANGAEGAAVTLAAAEAEEPEARRRRRHRRARRRAEHKGGAVGRSGHAERNADAGAAESEGGRGWRRRCDDGGCRSSAEVEVEVCGERRCGGAWCGERVAGGVDGRRSDRLVGGEAGCIGGGARVESILGAEASLLDL